MRPSSVAVALPIRDRRTSFVFFTDGLGFEAVGKPSDDGIPEPLQLVLGDRLLVVLVPTRGFGWVIGDRKPAPAGRSECLVRLDLETPDDVRALIEAARAAGGEIVREPDQQPWGYEGLFADPDGHLWLAASGSDWG